MQVLFIADFKWLVVKIACFSMDMFTATAPGLPAKISHLGHARAVAVSPICTARVKAPASPFTQNFCPPPDRRESIDQPSSLACPQEYTFINNIGLAHQDKTLIASWRRLSGSVNLVKVGEHGHPTYKLSWRSY
jgi:hypothetical protein